MHKVDHGATTYLATAALALVVLSTCGLKAAQPAISSSSHARPTNWNWEPEDFLRRQQWTTNCSIDLKLARLQLNTNIVFAEVMTGSWVPQEIAVIVRPLPEPVRLQVTNVVGAGKISGSELQRGTLKPRRAAAQMDWQNVPWIPFRSRLAIDLGPGEGRREVLVAGKWQSGEERLTQASGATVRVDYTPPALAITNPASQLTSQPTIQLQGWSDEPLRSLTYDLVNETTHLTEQQGLVNDQYYDPLIGELSTNYFTCYDVDLVPGTNTILIHAQDFAGNTSSLTLIYLLDLEHDRVPPVIKLEWPLPDQQLSGESFTARGRLDDPTARLTAVASAGVTTNTVAGLVERTGYFWAEDIPLVPGANQVELTATDAAGNSAHTNLVVYQTGDVLTMDPVDPGTLWQNSIRVTGQVRPPNRAVWVNGVQAEVESNGHWVADKVPIVSPNGGTAVFDIGSLPLTNKAVVETPNRSRGPTEAPRELVSVVSNLSTNAMTLNSGRPACGTFNLRLNGKAGRSFILEVSTNLVDWTPILTNSLSRAYFDYVEPASGDAACRFFRVTPVP